MIANLEHKALQNINPLPDVTAWRIHKPDTICSAESKALIKRDSCHDIIIINNSSLSKRSELLQTIRP
jgi:hypothetical protein